MNKGIIYCATGKSHVNEAIVSAQSLRKNWSNIKTCIFTDEIDSVANLGVFDIVKKHKEPTYSFLDKITPLGESPFEYNLFLDSDTYINESCDELFELIEKFDLAVTHDPWRLGPEVNCPDCFPEFNTGVIVYRKNEKVLKFLKDWEHAHRNKVEIEPTIGDQASFREQLYHSDLKFFIFTNEYNFRTCYPNFAGETVNVKIFHGGANNWEEYAQTINHTKSARVFLGSLEQFNQNSFNFYTKGGRNMLKTLDKLYRTFRTIKRR